MVTLGVVLGSVRPGRQAARVAKFVQNEFARNYPEVSISVIDPLEAKLPLLSNRYEFIKNSAECPPTLHTLHKQFTKCDGFVVVSPEYNHSIPPALTNTLDYFWQAEYSHKPVGIITYSMGQLAGFGAAVALLPWLNGLGMIAIPKMFSVAAIHNALNEEGQVPGNSSFPKIAETFAPFSDELVSYTRLLKEARAAGFPRK